MVVRFDRCEYLVQIYQGDEMKMAKQNKTKMENKKRMTDEHRSCLYCGRFNKIQFQLSI